MYHSVTLQTDSLILYQHKFLILLLLILGCTSPQPGQNELVSEPLPVPTFKRISQEQYGVEVGAHQVIQDSFPEDQLLVDLLQSHGVSRNLIDTIDARASQGFNTRNMKAGNPYTILKSTESGKVDFFMYEEDAENYIVIDFRDSVFITRGNQPVNTEIRAAYLPITTSLYDVARANQVDVAIVKSIEKIFAREIDFRKNDVGDKCQVLFEERYVDGRFIGVGRILAALFQQGDQEFSAFLFEQGDTTALYYDKEGTAVHEPFLPYITPDTTLQIQSSWKSRLKAYDLMIPSGTPILAPVSSTISELSPGKLELRHRAISRLTYQGVFARLPFLAPGDSISAGDTIALVGKAEENRLLLYYSQNGKQMQIPLSSDPEISSTDYLVKDRAAFRELVRSYSKALHQASPEA